MISLLMPLVLGLTVVLSVGIGVIAAYAAVFGILEICGRTSPSQPREPRPRLVLVPTQSQVGGD